MDAAETPLGRYYRQVTGQVEKKWHVYLHLRRDGATAGYLQIVFYVNKKGKVESLRVVNDKESNPILTELTVRAMKPPSWSMASRCQPATTICASASRGSFAANASNIFRDVWASVRLFVSLAR